MLQIAVCEDEQADRDDITGILKPLLDKYTEEYHITNFTLYTTNYGQYCMDAVNTVHAFAFLEKPVSAGALEEQLQAFLRQYQKEEVRLEFRNVSYEKNGVLSEKPPCCFPLTRSCTLNTSRQKRKSGL